MDKSQRIFLSILRAAMEGGQLPPPEDLTAEERQAVLKLAAEHKVLPLVLEACPALPEPEQLPILKHQVRRQVILQSVRTGEFLALERKLREAGIDTIVTKGILCRELWPKPDHRASADEDVLIRPEAFEACHSLLTEQGLATEMPPEQMASAYEVPYRRAGSPLYIELHKHLFPPESRAYGSWNRFFEGAFERSVEVTIQGQPIRTLGHTDHLLYLILHAFKHFLHSGFGIRQVCDIVRFAERYGQDVDWDLILDRCRQLRADRFAATVLRIGRLHLGFDPESAGVPALWRTLEADEGPMLSDLLDSGIYGSSTRSRSHSSTVTLEAVAGRSKKSSLLSTVFPSAQRLEGRYPWLKERPWLLPAAWAGRLWTYAGETRRRSDSSAAETLKIASERMALLKHYGIL